MNRQSTYLPAADSNWQRAGWLLLVLFTLFALVVDKAASTVFAVLFLAGTWLLVTRRAERTDRLMAGVLAAFALYFLVGVLAYFLGEQTRLGEQLLGRDIRFLAAIPVYFALRALRVPVGLLIAGLGLGGVIAGSVAIVQVALTGEARATGESISILFGHLSAALAVVNLAFALHGKGRVRWIALAGAAGSLVAVLLSGTRGAAVTVAVVGGLVFLAWCAGDRRRWMKAGVAVAVLLAAIVLTPLGERLVERARDGVQQVREHFYATDMLDAHAGIHALPGCLDSPELLRWLIDSGTLSIVRDATIEVVKDDDFAVTHPQCTGGAFLRLRSTGAKYAGVVLPERSVAPDSGHGGTFVVRGKGGVRLVAEDSKVHRFNTKQPRMLELETEPHEAGAPMARTIIDVSAGAQVDFVMLATVPGEYRYIDASGTIVSRFYMWQAAAAGLHEAPVLGAGTGAFPVLLEQRAQAGDGPWQLVQYDHAHNEMLTVGAERGVVGMLALLLLYVAPLQLFRFRGDLFGLAGIALVGAFAVSGLTETIFNHSLAITYYCMLVLLLAAVPGQPLAVRPTN